MSNTLAKLKTLFLSICCLGGLCSCQANKNEVFTYRLDTPFNAAQAGFSQTVNFHVPKAERYDMVVEMDTRKPYELLNREEKDEYFNLRVDIFDFKGKLYKKSPQSRLHLHIIVKKNTPNGWVVIKDVKNPESFQAFHDSGGPYTYYLTSWFNAEKGDYQIIFENLNPTPAFDTQIIQLSVTNTIIRLKH
ncbi:hypothetical protein [Stenoxybacter acetivorans]|uniref:hypothetical protein n=1 Tax=Stenoxybacter acetivorans TaxID=422441 RepID=UPI00056A5F41|nr:hypothetical protein [Stenoxybacter acetivorans]